MDRFGGHLAVGRGPLGGAPGALAWAEVSSTASSGSRTFSHPKPQASTRLSRSPRRSIISTKWDINVRVHSCQEPPVHHEGPWVPRTDDIKGRGRRLPTITVVGSSAHASSSSPPGGFVDYYIQAIKTKTINGSVTAYVLYLKAKG